MWFCNLCDSNILKEAMKDLQAINHKILKLVINDWQFYGSFLSFFLITPTLVCRVTGDRE